MQEIKEGQEASKLLQEEVGNTDKLPPLSGTAEWKQLYATIAKYAKSLDESKESK